MSLYLYIMITWN